MRGNVAVIDGGCWGSKRNREARIGMRERERDRCIEKERLIDG